MSKLNIILNDTIVEGYEDETILHLANKNNIEIPTLCSDPRLKPYSSCYLCVVEVEGMRGLQPACSTYLKDGMRIVTDNERIVKSRRFALELLASNHYADCVAPCQEECPAGVDVQGYIALIDRGLYSEAVGLIKQTNPLPAICGRVCVRPCELVCRRNFVDEIGVGIDYLKRYTSDKDLQAQNPYKPNVKASTGKKVAIIGAGPGGLTAAHFLAIEGHLPEIFEANPHPGGMLRYGIPPYRLPNDIIDKEVEAIENLGVKIHYNQKLGENLSYKELKNKYDSVVLAIGSQKGTNIGCENDDAGNIFSGIEFLRNMEMTGQPYDFTGKKVAVIGGGNTAMDCCRTAMRCGADKVMVIYRRTEKQMPANPIEIHESKLEGIEYMFLTSPAKVNTDEQGNLKTLTCIKMELGEPDASGRRRPVKIEGSEFEIELDYILAAIGQKTVVNFIDDINQNTESELKLNKWGDIDANPDTLQTSISSIFACGDGVTGPATLIEAIAQGRKAAYSCNLFLNNEKVAPEPGEFISYKDNFKEQTSEDYINRFPKQERSEMPTLDPDKRKNFKEVELGYSDEDAIQETQRCLECGCSELYYCDLKKYATDYNADQHAFFGDYKEHIVDFSHPYVEIDNNKCILCSSCIRICHEVVGANALGLVNRGFETYVAPSMEGKLADTKCESCGLCISACPTGAITENIPFKPGPLKNETFNTICNYCSIGCEMTMHHKSSLFNKVTGNNGLVNKDSNICRYARFGYKYLNDNTRITKPLVKKNGKFVETSFENAFELIAEKIKNSRPDENGFFGGARLTNEELFMIHKLAKEGVKTTNVGSFHYTGRGSGYYHNSKLNVPFEQLKYAGHIYAIGTDLNYENSVAGFEVYNSSFMKNIPLELITTSDDNNMAHKATKVLKIKSYYHFIKAVNHYIISNKMYNKAYTDGCNGFDEYSKNLLSGNFEQLIKQSGLSGDELKEFCNNYIKEEKAILVFGEKNLSANTCYEIRNLAMITGKLGKTAAGIISLKEKNNSQGIFDIAKCTSLVAENDAKDTQESVKDLTVSDNPAPKDPQLWDKLIKGELKNLFIFGEDPTGCAVDKDAVSKALAEADFKVIQDYFLTDTAKECDLILPATLPFETGGSFANTQKYIQQFHATIQSPVEESNFDQLLSLQKTLGITDEIVSPSDAFEKIAEKLNKLSGKANNDKTLVYTTGDNYNRMFEHGCDYLVKRFDEEFHNAF